METAITEKITPDQTAQLTRFVDDMIRKLGLSKDAAQLLIKNFHLVKPELEQVLQKHSIADKRFELLKTFEITVPANYNHGKRLDSFAKENKKKFYYYNDDITDKNFSKATTKLEPNKVLTVKVFGIKATVTSQNCMDFLKTQDAILTGAQGASLVWEQKKDELPVDKWSVSFDEKDALWEDSGGDHRVPGVRRYSDGDFEFGLGCFEGDWGSDYCLLCFCDK